MRTPYLSRLAVFSWNFLPKEIEQVFIGCWDSTKDFTFSQICTRKHPKQVCFSLHEVLLRIGKKSNLYINLASKDLAIENLKLNPDHHHRL